MKSIPNPTTPALPLADLTRRQFVQVLGAGLLIAVSADPARAQQRGGGRNGANRARGIAARVHIAKDGTITVMTGKVEAGQGARAEISQAAAEELRVPVAQIQLLMADTSLVPDDGVTAGSRTTPGTIPVVRQGCAAARQLLVQLAARRWGVQPNTLTVRDGKITHADGQKTLAYADLAATEDLPQAFAQDPPPDVTITPVDQWKALGASVPRPNARDLVTGAHLFPSDIQRPGMLYGKVLRPPSFGAKLTSIDLAPAKAMPGVVVVQDGSFIGVAAPTKFLARQALDAISQTAQWEPAPHPSSKELFTYLKDHAQGGLPKNPFADELTKAAKTLRASFQVAYVQHTPMETRAAVAEWTDGKLTVWTGTQNPFGVHGDLARALGLPTDQVRVIVPDFGGGFGGKHTNEAPTEAARLAKAAGKPVSLQWTRQEELTYAYFRPAAAIEIQATLDPQGALTSWHFVNINSGGSGIDTPYRAGRARSQSVNSNAPLKQGSYRALASTANNFARECFMDELAAAAGLDPLQFRLNHLDHPRLRPVLEAAAQRFDWNTRYKTKAPNIGVGLACGTEKGSYVAACVEIEILPQTRQINVRKVCQVFECGKILNPDNLLAQVHGCIIQGLGPALREQMIFENGKMLNAFLRQYGVPRFADVPELDIHLLDRPDLPPAGGGETPIMAIAPAIANAVFHITAQRVREMPIPTPA